MGSSEATITKSSGADRAPELAAFPWHLVARASLDEALASNESTFDFPRIDAALLFRALFDSEISTTVGPPTTLALDRVRARLLDPLHAVIFEDVRSGGRAGLVLDRALVAACVARTLDLQTPRGEIAAMSPDFISKGMVLYAAARAFAQGDNAASWRVVGFATTRDELLAGMTPTVAAVPIGVSALGITARLTFIAGRSLRSLRAESSVPISEDIAELRLDLTGRIGHAALTTSEWNAVEVGDIVVPDELTMSALGYGQCKLVFAETAGTFATAQVSSDGAQLERLVGDVIPVTQGSNMTATKTDLKALPGAEPDTDASEDLTALASASTANLRLPISIEIARFRLSVTELSQLQVGDILSTGTPIGTDVRLLVGESAIATGEIVEIEGELGIRITKKLVT